MQLKKSLEEYQKISKSVVVQHIGEGAGNFFGVRRIFARILPNVPEKNSIKSDLQKKALHVILGAVGRHSCSYFLEFAHIFKDFVKVCTDLPRFPRDFFPNFHQIKTFGGALTHPTPRFLHEWCSIKSECYDKC